MTIPDERRTIFIISAQNPDSGARLVFFAGIAPMGEDLARAADWAREKFQQDSMHVDVCRVDDIDRSAYQLDWSEVQEYRTGNELWDHVAARTRIWYDSY